MADEENTTTPAAMDLNLYLGLPRSSRPLTLDLGSDLSLSSLLPPSSSSNCGESRAPETTSVAMEASASHAPYSSSHVLVGEVDVRVDVENPMRPYFHAYEPYSCVQEGSGPLYSPSNVPGLQIEQMGVDPAERDVNRHSSVGEILGYNLLAVDSSVHGDDFQTPPSRDFHDEQLLRPTDFRIRRVMESHGLRRQNLFAQSLYDRANFLRNALPSSNHMFLEPLSSPPNGKRKAAAESVDAESSENGGDEKNKCSSNFECNVCFDMSKEPVVTSCGHLFCWPCLYQWLHVHSQHKECPVCKGEVVEANIIPIYGRGSCGSEMESKDEESKALGLSIPPRPRGHRAESWRQRYYRSSRRTGEGIANPRWHFPNFHISSGSRVVGLDDAVMQEIFSREPPSFVTRSMIRRLERAQEITESGTANEESRFIRFGELLPRDGSAAPVTDEIDIAMNPGRRSGGSFPENTGRNGITLPVNFPTLDHIYGMPFGRHATDQASVSSTVAMITGESSVRDASIEPNSAGSSRPPRTMRGNCVASSSDDGGNLRSRKRRRLQ